MLVIGNKTHTRLKSFCKGSGLVMSAFVDVLINNALDNEEQSKKAARRSV
jgi:hypothetical protein